MAVEVEVNPRQSVNYLYCDRQNHRAGRTAHSRAVLSLETCRASLHLFFRCVDACAILVGSRLALRDRSFSALLCITPLHKSTQSNGPQLHSEPQSLLSSTPACRQLTMRLSVLLTLASSLLYLGAATPIEKRSQCATQLSLAASIANRLMSYWYNSTAGYFNSGSLWTDANTIEDFHNLMLAAGTDTYYTIDQTSQTGKDGQAASASTWSSTINGSNDDSLVSTVASHDAIPT